MYEIPAISVTTLFATKSLQKQQVMNTVHVVNVIFDQGPCCEDRALVAAERR